MPTAVTSEPARERNKNSSNSVKSSAELVVCDGAIKRN